ncbi:hypothetical protein [Alkalimarinus alittae]|uniref:Uncharacterized protein n=1 Tax=Alkalimarinus alittae TaxID=2961619 RepID=A0ABY6MX88_9ALTE|nr:hypothetical protein [Alkalimarinus alittae]UZE94438.1 hypothetical protein NKI27_10065 [Alkalimarinus alittae]
MSQEPFFSHLDSSTMADFISIAKRAVVYAGPGIHMMAVQAMIIVAEQLGNEMVTVNLDVDERVIRMGYGDFEAIKLLQEKGITVNHTPELRSALLVVDDNGFSFSPTALYLEAESNTPTAFNAIRLTSEQVKEALARLSPVAKVIAIAQSENDVEKQRLEELSLDIISQPVSEDKLASVELSLNQAPPVKFDVARQVRVYESYLQYIEMSLSGVAIQRHRLTIPPSLQKLGEGNKEIEGRLRTTFDLVEKDGPLSSKQLEDALNEIRKNFTPSLGKDHGRVLLKAAKKHFEERVKEFRGKLTKYEVKVKETLQSEIDKSRSAVSDYYLPLVKENPPDELLGGLLSPPSDQDLLCWIKYQLDKVFPNAEDLIKTMKLEIHYKDVTFETLNRGDFLDSVKQAFPNVDWDKAHEEFTAASEG